MTRTILLATAALLLASPAALSQSEQPAAGGETVAAAPVDTQTFIQTAASGDQFEIRSSQLAVDGGAEGAVGEFANRMIADHTTSSQRLVEALQAASEGEPPPVQDAMLEKHQQMLSQIEQAGEGDARSAAYVENQVAAHREAVALYSAYAESGDNEALVAFARETLPTIEQHLAEAESLAAR